jgi:hypothetical protein
MDNIRQLAPWGEKEEEEEQKEKRKEELPIITTLDSYFLY